MRWRQLVTRVRTALLTTTAAVYEARNVVAAVVKGQRSVYDLQRTRSENTLLSTIWLGSLIRTAFTTAEGVAVQVQRSVRNLHRLHNGTTSTNNQEVD